LFNKRKREQELPMAIAKRMRADQSRTRRVRTGAIKTRKKAAKARENPRQRAMLESAKQFGLLEGASSRIAARIRKSLIDPAKANSGIKSDTELLEYALACVALEDDFAQKLLARAGSIPKDIDLEF
jgi:hypothetical protein